MKKTIYYLVPRLALIFVISLLGYYFVVIQPYQSKQRTVREHVEAVTRLDRALGDIRQRIEVLPSPESVKLAQSGPARQYAQKLQEATVITNIEYPKKIEPIANPDQDEQLGRFNAVVRNPEHWKVLTQVELTLRSSDGLIEHQSAVMKALTNLLQYDPKLDLNSDDKNILSQQLAFAQSGMQTTLQRLEAAPKYNDSGLKELTSYVNQAQTARGTMAEAIDSGSDIGAAKETFFNEISKLQQSIRANREKFWSAEREKHLKTLLEARQSLRPHLLILGDIQT